ncbi:hypothetical protein FNV43_RR26361 [Rhamnella rubrinervis]|uniref:Uncharacterized protein n=1 Tax=Rhamnella rubrinervis TaxID=2594499 RepID=A0A8K0DIN7_9ROSA|nr:hypothetical protein FNV43_RR26361 [Rhamnella rubrinervis]
MENLSLQIVFFRDSCLAALKTQRLKRLGHVSATCFVPKSLKDLFASDGDRRGVRKRKELQTFRRMEAKRRRSEKQRNTINSAQSEKEGSFSEEDKLQQHQQHGGGASANTPSSTVAPLFGLPT